MGIGVHLDRDAARRGLGEHLVQVDRVGLPLEQQAAGRVAENREMGIVHGGEHASSHLRFRHSEA